MQPEKPQKTVTFKTILQSIWNALHRRPLLKLAALLVAFVFWAVLIASDPNRVTEKVILNAPVTVSGQEALRSTKRLTVMDDISTGTITVKMRVEVKQADYDRATADVFTPQLNLNAQITHEGPNQRVYFTAAPNAYGQVLAFEPEYVELDVEAFISRSRVPIVVEKTGASATPLWLDTPTTDPAQVAVTGPKSLVDQVRRAVVKLPLDSLSEMRPLDSISSTIELQDANGNVISSPLMRIANDTITVDDVRIDVSVYPMKEVPIDLESLVTGVPGHGYRLESVTVTPEQVAIAADADALSEIEALYIATPLSLEGQTQSVTALGTLRVPSSVRHTAATEVTIEARIVPATHVHVYADLPIVIMGASADLSTKLSHTSMDVIIRGDYDKVQSLRGQDIMLYVEATDLEEGVHMVDVQCLVNGTDTYEFEAEVPRVTLTLTPAAQ